MIDPNSSTVIATIAGALASGAAAAVAIINARHAQRLTHSQEAVNWEGIANRAQTREDRWRLMVEKLQDQNDLQLAWQSKAAVIMQRCAENDPTQAEEIMALLKLTNRGATEATSIRAMIEAERQEEKK